MLNGWDTSAEAWIADMGEDGDFSRTHVLDQPMLAAVRHHKPDNLLDVGCGEGRFCRMVAREGIEVMGLDPTAAMLRQARLCDPDGRYVDGQAEALPFAAGSFDMVVSYLTLIDIEDYRKALSEMARVLRPSGHLLIANLNSFVTAIPEDMENSSWERDAAGNRLAVRIDNYLTPRGGWFEWRDIRVFNHHRPMRDYMQALLGLGLMLIEFDEPGPCRADGPAEATDAQARVPYFHIMCWRKP
ncbi:class I SAM-dependent methyltransferase [Halovulum sp. GXIMD14793]